MPSRDFAFVCLLAIAAASLPQQPSAQKPATFHIHARVVGAPNPCPVTLTALGASEGLTVNPSDDGTYSADLPLGTYTMKLCPAWDDYARPLFRVAAPAAIQQEVYLHPVNHRQKLPVAAADGTPFEIRAYADDYEWGLTGDHQYHWNKRKNELVRVEYNTYTLWAEFIYFHKRARQLEASGLVTLRDASGQDQHFRKVRLSVDDGVLNVLSHKN